MLSEVHETFVDHGHAVLFRTEIQDLPQGLLFRQQACRIVGIGQEKQLRSVDTLRQFFRTQEKAIRFRAGHDADLTVFCLQRLPILFEIRRCQQRLLRPQNPADPVDQIRRSVSADDLYRRDSVLFRQLFLQCPAERVRIPIRFPQCLQCRFVYSLREAEGADIG